jgi:DNA-directed RNA polymerase subunit RPC12/RpoP
MFLSFRCVRCGKSVSAAPSEESLRYSEEKGKGEDTKKVTVRCPHCGAWNTVKAPG